MKNILFFILFLLLGTTYLTAQGEYKKAFSGSGERFLEVVFQKGAIAIEAYDGSEVVFSTSEGYDGPPERARGLKPMYNSAVDNTNIGLEVKESSNKMTVYKAIGEELDYLIKVPRSVNIKIQELGWQGNWITVQGMTGEVEVEGKNSDIRITEVTGPVVAHCTSGNIEVVFTTINQQKPISVSNTSGFVDVSIPANTPADVRMSSVTGEIFTNLDIDMGTEKLKKIGGGKVNGTINGGGVEINLRAISDNIYLRKREK